MSRRRNRNSRRGVPFYRTSRRLPPAHESVRRSLLERRAFELPRRAFQTAPLRAPARAVFVSQVEEQPKAPRQSLWAQLRRLQMAAPRKVLFCVRRRVRREVLFAAGIGGTRGLRGRRGRYRRTQESSFTC